ncbi:MAG TPA: hydrolase, partial [Idiomarina loihiensis]|nr:hydrolase [Idiomarina loihiensis]
MSPDELHLQIRNLRLEDYEQLKELMDAVYTDIGGSWSQFTIEKLIKDFSEGQFCLEDNGRIVGVALTVKVAYTKFSNPHAYDDLIGHREAILNNKKGDALYGLDVLIHPEYRGYRLGRRLYDARKELCRQANLRAILAGGRIVNYHKYANELTPSQYLDKVQRREIYDPILTFQLANDFSVKRLLGKYLPEDKKSRGFATLLEWNNFLYEPSDNILTTRIQNVRVG